MKWQLVHSLEVKTACLQSDSKLLSVSSKSILKTGSIIHHGRQPQIALFWPRFGSGFKCIVTKRKSAFLLTLTYYFEATVTPAGISSYFLERLFITMPLNYKHKRNYIINPSGTALVLGAVVKIVSLLRNRVPFYCFKRFRSES